MSELSPPLGRSWTTRKISSPLSSSDTVEEAREDGLAMKVETHRVARGGREVLRSIDRGAPPLIIRMPRHAAAVLYYEYSVRASEAACHEMMLEATLIQYYYETYTRGENARHYTTSKPLVKMSRMCSSHVLGPSPSTMCTPCAESSRTISSLQQQRWFASRSRRFGRRSRRQSESLRRAGSLRRGREC